MKSLVVADLGGGAIGRLGQLLAHRRHSRDQKRVEPRKEEAFTLVVGRDYVRNGTFVEGSRAWAKRRVGGLTQGKPRALTPPYLA